MCPLGEGQSAGGGRWIRNRLLAVVVLAAVVVSVLGGLALADGKPGAGKPSERALVRGKEEPRPVKDRTGSDGPARRDKEAAIPRARTARAQASTQTGAAIAGGEGRPLNVANVGGSRSLERAGRHAPPVSFRPPVACGGKIRLE